MNIRQQFLDQNQHILYVGVAALVNRFRKRRRFSLTVEGDMTGRSRLENGNGVQIVSLHSGGIAEPIGYSFNHHNQELRR
jgi:hypothetical protein